MTDVKTLRLKVIVGEIPSAAVLGPKLSALGANPKAAGDAILAATKAFKGIKVNVELKVENKNCTARMIESAGANVLKALGEPGRDSKKVKNVKHDGNITLDQVKEIAKVLQERSKSKLFKGAVKEILGTCVSVGCTVDKKDPKAVQKMIDAGEIAIDE